MVAAWAATSVVLTGIGLAVVEWWEPSRLGAADTDVNRWLAEHRSPVLNELADLGAAFSDTRTVLLLAVPLLSLLLWWFRRWHEATLLVGALVLESAMYLVPSRLVARERPAVEQIAGPTNDHSFPSGHVAAAIALYGALAVIVFWHSRARWAHRTLAVVVVVVPVWVAWSRAYAGAHHVTDYVGSLVMGIVALATMGRVVRPDSPDTPRPRRRVSPSGPITDRRGAGDVS